MLIDNSAANAWSFCPAKYQETYEHGYQKRPSGDSRDFGSRVHELLKSHFLELKGEIYTPPESPLSPELENEAQEMFEKYKAAYPIEDFDVVDVENYFEVPLPNSSHTYHGKMDGVVRDKKSGRLRLLEHKTEQRNAKSNLPEVWAARPQVGLYLYAGHTLYGEPFDDIILDVLTRRSPAGRIEPCFRRDTLQRTQEQITEATTNITWIADQIERLRDTHKDKPWPQFRENCCRGGFKCDFYHSHVVAECQVIQLDEVARNKYYVQADNYLDL